MKQSKKEPLRTCSGCGLKRPKAKLLRVVKTPDGEIVCDTTGKLSGRGAYLCFDLKCLLSAKKKRRFERSFKGKIPEELYAQLEEKLKK